MKYRTLCGWLLAAAVVATLAAAQDNAPQRKEAATEDAQADAVRAVSASFVTAYNAKDAKALGGLFTEGAEIEDDDGTITRGRDAIVDRYVHRFADGEKSTLSVDIASIRFLSPTLAIEEGTARIKDADEPSDANRYTVLYAKQDGRWLTARVKDETPDQPTANEQLKELEWMRGEWVNESDDAIVSTSCDWSDDGSFLMRRFDMKIEGSIALKGSQRIGWDPVMKQFRTWVFDNEGGFAEGLMARDGERWVVKISGTRADGQTASATTIITRLGPDRIGWESTDRTLGGEVLAGIDQFILVKKPPEPGK